MAVQPQWVPNLEAPAISELSSAQLTSLKEITDRVSNSVEATTKEFENLTSWLLHRGERECKERHGFIQTRKVPVKKHSHRSLNPGDRQTRSQGRWDVHPWDPCFEEIQKFQPYGESRGKLHCHTNLLLINRIIVGQYMSKTKKPSVAGREKAER
jgi:hypothetical protein